MRFDAGNWYTAAVKESLNRSEAAGLCLEQGFGFNPIRGDACFVFLLFSDKEITCMIHLASLRQGINRRISKSPQLIFFRRFGGVARSSPPQQRRPPPPSSSSSSSSSQFYGSVCGQADVFDKVFGIQLMYLNPRVPVRALPFGSCTVMLCLVQRTVLEDRYIPCGL